MISSSGVVAAVAVGGGVVHLWSRGGLMACEMTAGEGGMAGARSGVRHMSAVVSLC